MLDEKWELQIIEIPEHSNVVTPPPAIGLTEALKPSGTINPFDISETLTRSASDYYETSSTLLNRHTEQVAPVAAK